MTEIELKTYIKNTEERYIGYKKSIEDLHKDKTDCDAWFKEWLRELKNSEESRLKHLRLEMEHLRAGMNPPYMYGYLRVNK